MASRLIVGPFRDNDDQEGNCLAMKESLVRNSTIRVWERAAERRLGVSRLLAQALELTRQPSHRTAVRSRLERDIGYLLNARSVSIRERVGTFQAMAVRERPGVLTMPIPGLSNPPMVLEVRAESQDLDAWARQRYDAASWPECQVQLPDQAECVGVPFEATAVALADGTDRLLWALAEPRPTTVQTVSSLGAQWGRLVHFVDGGTRVAVDLRVTTWLEKRDRPGVSGSRVRFVPDSSTQVYQLDSRSTWIAGRNNAEGRFLEVKGEGTETVRVSAERLRDTDAEQPFTVFLRSPVSVTGAIVDSAGQPAGGSLVSVFELIPLEATDAQGTHQDAFEKRWIAETFCDHDGNFFLSGPPPGRYEFLVAHPTHGRATEERELKRFSNRPCTTWGGRGTSARTDACLFDGSARAGAPRQRCRDEGGRCGGEVPRERVVGAATETAAARHGRGGASRPATGTARHA